MLETGAVVLLQLPTLTLRRRPAAWAPARVRGSQNWEESVYGAVSDSALDRGTILLMWQLNIATLIRFFTAVLLAPCGATAKHGNYYSGKFMFFKLE